MFFVFILCKQQFLGSIYFCAIQIKIKDEHETIIMQINANKLRTKKLYGLTS